MSFLKTIVIGVIVCAGAVMVGFFKRKTPIKINRVSIDMLDYKYILNWLQENKSIIQSGAELVTLRNKTARELLQEHFKYEMSENEVLYVLQLKDQILAHIVVHYKSISDSYLDMLGNNDVYTQKIE